MKERLITALLGAALLAGCAERHEEKKPHEKTTEHKAVEHKAAEASK